MSFIRKIIASFFLLACFQVVVMQVLPHHHHHHMICVLSDVEELAEDHHDAAHQEEESEADDDCCITKLQAVVDKLQNTDSSYNLLCFQAPAECVIPLPAVEGDFHKYLDFNDIDCCKRPISPSIGRAPPQYS